MGNQSCHCEGVTRPKQSHTYLGEMAIVTLPVVPNLRPPALAEARVGKRTGTSNDCWDNDKDSGGRAGRKFALFKLETVPGFAVEVEEV